MAFGKKKDDKKKDELKRDIGENFTLIRLPQDPCLADFEDALSKGWYPLSITKPYGEDWLLLFGRVAPGEAASGEAKESKFMVEGMPITATSEDEAKQKYEQIRALMG